MDRPPGGFVANHSRLIEGIGRAGMGASFIVAKSTDNPSPHALVITGVALEDGREVWYVTGGKRLIPCEDQAGLPATVGPSAGSTVPGDRRA